MRSHFKPHAVNKELDGDDDDEDAKAFRDQSLDDILATRSKAVVLAIGHFRWCARVLIFRNASWPKVRDAASMYVLQRDAVDAMPPAATLSTRVATVSVQHRRRTTLPSTFQFFWDSTLGKDALKQKKEIVDTTQRKAKQGDKEYVRATVPWIASRNEQRDADYCEDVPEDKKSSTPTTGARRKQGSCG